MTKAGTPDRRARSLRIAVAGSDLFVDRTVALLNRWGMDARRVERGPSRVENWRRGLSTDLYLRVTGISQLSRLQRCLARLGVPTLIRWSGSDVATDGPRASSFVIEQAWHWCVAPWLGSELDEAGISAEIVPLLLVHVPDPPPGLPDEFTVLAYVPAQRSALYGLEFVTEVARKRPDIQFRLVATASETGLPSNVKALGWIDDLPALMAQTTVYLRPTVHDGLANMVLEALVYGRHVLWTYPYPGVDTVGTVEDAATRLSELHARHAQGGLGLNLEGRNAVSASFDEAIVRQDIHRRLEAIAAQGWRTPPGRVHRLIARSALATLRAVFRVDRVDLGGPMEYRQRKVGIL